MWARVAQRRDDGFTLIESIVALSLAVIIFMALTFAMIGGMHEVLFSQQNQQAGDILNQTIENARALSYDSLVMQDTDLDAGEVPVRSPLLSVALCYNPTKDSTTSTGGTCEGLAHAAVGGITQHVKPVTQNGGKYTVKTYVTKINEGGGNAGTQYKHLTVVVSWVSAGKTHTRISSTFISPTKRGLPLPNFKFSPNGSLTACKNPGSPVVYQFSLVNNGARDQWLMSTNTATPTWSYYADTNNNQTYDAGVDQPLDTFNGSPTTGLLDTNVNKIFFAVATPPDAATQAPPYTWNVAFTATSAAIATVSQTQSTVTGVTSGACGAPTPTPTPTPTATPTATPTPTPTPGAPTQPAAPCTPGLGTATTSTPSGATMVRYWLYNSGQPGNVNAAADQPVIRDGGTSPAAGNLYAYSQDLAAGTAGRYVNTSGTSVATTASWVYQMPAASQVKKGTGELTLYAAPASGSATATPSFTVTVTAGGAAFSSGSFPATSWGCTGFRAFSVQLSMPNNQTIAANALVRVSVTSTVPVVFAYGTGTFPSEFEMPYTSGNG